jgi:hypothetical protein
MSEECNGQFNLIDAKEDLAKKQVTALNARYLIDPKRRTRGGAAILLNLTKILKK